MARRILVTAGASGIGLAIAQAFEAEGARVDIGDIDEAALDAAAAGRSRLSGSVVDISRPDQVDRLVADVQRNLGGLDVLVNNAGIAGPTAPVAEYDEAAWRSVIDVNLNGTFYVTARCIPLLRQSDMASILVMSSLAGRFGYPNRSAYSTTKWGLVGFAKTLALELGPEGITCNSIHPGAVEGPRLRKVLEGRAEKSGRTLEDETALALANQSVKRFVSAADIAALALFLAGPNARSISGQMFPIDGDSNAAV